MRDDRCIVPDWPAPTSVHSLVTTRNGGVSRAPFASLNLGGHVGDDPDAVTVNRERVVALVGGSPLWLNQVHGIRVVDAAEYSPQDVPPEADAAFSRQAGVVCTVMTADCLPVLFCNDAG